jgi:hypothetical protein
LLGSRAFALIILSTTILKDSAEGECDQVP